jgi:hypothetical protein
MPGIILPTEVVKAKYQSPRKSLFYGIAKVGKTTALAQLKNNLIFDLEGGTELIDSLAVQIRSVGDIQEVLEAIKKKGIENAAAGKTGNDLFPYRYITIDTIDALEEFCDASALARYKAGKLCSAEQKMSLMSITELPHGAGYYYLREEVKRVINLVSSCCERIILISHVKDRIINEKQGATATVKDISLSGKLSSIICANMDAIGYLYRQPGTDELQVSFESYDANTVMGARCPHLAAKRMPLDWSKIFID